MAFDAPTVCVIGDVHGHLQLALCVAARWQQVLGVAFDAVLLCGDVGTFTSEDQIDSATRRHAKGNPCELEFLYQWAAKPQPPWLQQIFEPLERQGLGLECPVIMVHGNHEGFAHLATLGGTTIPGEPIPAQDLPSMDTGHHIRYLPSGWRCMTPAGIIVAGVGGIERSQRQARYHEMAYLDEGAILHLLYQAPVDLLITHQGPSGLQGEHGSQMLQLLLDAGLARVWCHGHSRPNKEIMPVGATGGTLVVPLGDIAFTSKGPSTGEPGEDGWAFVSFGSEPTVRRERPEFWRAYRRKHWVPTDGGQLVCPDLAGAIA
jgi:hypothetical protein